MLFVEKRNLKIGFILGILLNGQLAQAEPQKDKFLLTDNLAANKRASYCTSKGYDTFETFGRGVHGYYIVCIGDNERITLFKNKLECDAFSKPIAEIEKELQGKLFLVQTLPGLSDNGTLISTFDPKGVHIKKSEHHKDSGHYIIDSDHLSTLHFTFNNLVPWNGRYAAHPFVIIAPVNQTSGPHPFESLTSISFTEAVTVGNLKLPKNSIIMYRKSQIEQDPALAEMLKYYHENKYEVIPFDDGGHASAGLDGHRSWIYSDYGKKKEAVKKAVLEHGGADIKLGENYFLEEVTGPTGENISTVDFFRKMVPHREVAVGSDEFTRYESNGGQWRSMALRAGSNRFYDDGFMIEGHQGQKYLEWMNKIGLPAKAIEHQSKFTKNMLIAYRAMDLAFGHFQKKDYAYYYIDKHLVERNDAKFKERFDREVNSDRSIDDLAKEYCDYEFLKKQTQGPFDLANKDDIIETLRSHTTMGMQPEEALQFFKDYFSKSAIYNHKNFTAQDREMIQNTVLAGYALLYLNHTYRPKKLSKERMKVLSAMLQPMNMEDVNKYYGGWIMMLSKAEPVSEQSQQVAALKKLHSKNLEELSGKLGD